MAIFDWLNQPSIGAGILGQPQLPTRGDYLTNLGFGLLAAAGPSPRPVGFGQAFGQAGLNANQLQQQALRNAYTNQLLAQQGQLLNNQMAREDQWQKLMGGAPDPAALAAGMSQPGMQPGPTPQALQSVQRVDPLAGFSPAQRALLGSMGAAQGAPAAFGALTKDETPIAVPAGTTLVNRRTMQPSFTAPPNAKDRYMNVEGQLYDISGSTPKLVSGTEGGPFRGTSMDAQTFNTLIKGDPGSPEYAAAYARASEPKVNFDQATGNWVSTNPDMSWARRPMRKAAPQAPAAPGDGAPVAPQPQSVPSTPLPGGGATVPLPGGGSITTGSAGGGKMTDTQATSALYADRMRESMKILDDPKITEAATSVMERGKAAIPGVGNFLVSKDYQKFEQAQRDFINATLRRESGAVISDAEFANARQQYFPQPGDSKDVIEQKKRNRQNALDGIARAAGPAYRPKADEPKKVLKYNPETGLIE